MNEPVREPVREPGSDPRRAYARSGVDVAAGERAVELMRASVASTHRPEVLGGLGGFGSAVAIPAGYREPVIVASTDGVGTKTAIAQAMGRFDTIGIDLVAMCADDVACTGAEPLTFLDYIAIGRLEPERVAALVSGIAEGCRQAGAALTGGAEHNQLLQRGQPVAGHEQIHQFATSDASAVDHRNQVVVRRAGLRRRGLRPGSWGRRRGRRGGVRRGRCRGFPGVLDGSSNRGLFPHAGSSGQPAGHHGQDKCSFHRHAARFIGVLCLRRILRRSGPRRYRRADPPGKCGSCPLA